MRVHCTNVMAKQIQLRRGTTTENNAFTGAVGEVTVDTDKDVLVVHDGVTAGGFPVAARANTDGTISLIKKDGTVITTIPTTGLFNNTLTSTNTDQALTAAQGKVLNDNKLSTAAAFGIGQTWQDVTAGRTLGTTYTNSTPKPIGIFVSTATNQNGYLTATVGGVVLGISNMSYYANTYCQLFFIVPPITTYRVAGVGVASLDYFSELK